MSSFAIRSDMLAVSRRAFLGRLSLGVTAAGMLPYLGLARDDEAYWRQVRSQFPLRPDFSLMNAANLCPSPYAVSETVAAYTRDIDTDASFQNRGKYSELYQDAITSLARLMGADPDEIVITRNTTESNNQVGNGLDLGPGDDVVLWDENHPSNNASWGVRAQRHGFGIRRVTLPQNPVSVADFVQPFLEVLSPQTRLVSFSHVSNISGIALPASELCSAVRQHGILTLIDGAQTFGVHTLNLHEIGCDFYTGSAHKWLMGPKEGGLLYMRRESQPKLWPSIIGMGWEDDLAGARRFRTQGQRDDGMCSAIGTAVSFVESIGNERVECRVRTLASALKAGIAARVPGAKLITPESEHLSGGVVVFAVEGWNHGAAFEQLYQEHGIAGALIGDDRLRLCPHVYNTMKEIERAISVLSSMSF